MPFRFPLASLLRLRQGLERQRAAQLLEASTKAARARGELAQIDAAIVESRHADAAALRAGCSAAELQFAVLTRASLQAARDTTEQQVKRLEAQRLTAAADYQRAFREREILETLSTQQRRTYQQDHSRREQHDLDAAHLLQLWRKRG